MWDLIFSFVFFKIEILMITAEKSGGSKPVSFYFISLFLQSSCLYHIIVSVSSTVLHVTVIHSFSLLYRIPLFYYAIIYLSVLILMSICVFSSLDLSQIVLLWIFLQYLNNPMHAFLSDIKFGVELQSRGLQIISISRQCQEVFQNGSTNIFPLVV